MIAVINLYSASLLQAMNQIRLSSTAKAEIMNITDKVAAIVASSGIKEGVCVISAAHTTAAVVLLEADGLVEKDLLRSLSSIVPNSASYEHQHGPDSGHGAAHVKSAILGPSKVLPVSSGKLALGAWQSIAFAELDGPRSDRVVFIQVVGR